MIASKGTKRPLWKCPRCGHRFVTKNLSHSCVNVSLSAHFRGKPLALKKTWDRWLAAARSCGRVTAYAQKTRLIIMTRVRFAGAVVRATHLDAHLWMWRRVKHPRLVRIMDYGKLGFGAHFRLESPTDIDAPLRVFMREASKASTTRS